MNIRQSTIKFQRTPSDARQLTIVGAVFVGVAACFWSLVPKPYSARTPQELSATVRESTLERLKWTPAPLNDPSTDAEKIEARWKFLATKISDENAVLIASRARAVFSKRCWPVDAFWGKVNGKGVWIILATGDDRMAKVPSVHMVNLKNGLGGSDEDGSYSVPRVVDPTEIAIIDAEAPFQLLFHDGRRKLI